MVCCVFKTVLLVRIVFVLRSYQLHIKYITLRFRRTNYFLSTSRFFVRLLKHTEGNAIVIVIVIETTYGLCKRNERRQNSIIVRYYSHNSMNHGVRFTSERFVCHMLYRLCIVRTVQFTRYYGSTSSLLGPRVHKMFTSSHVGINFILNISVESSRID